MWKKEEMHACGVSGFQRHEELHNGVPRFTGLPLAKRGSVFLAVWSVVGSHHRIPTPSQLLRLASRCRCHVRSVSCASTCATAPKRTSGPSHRWCNQNSQDKTARTAVGRIIWSGISARDPIHAPNIGNAMTTHMPESLCAYASWHICGSFGY